MSTEPSHSGEGTTTTFTPDNRWVVYSTFGAGIWKVPADGGQPVPIFEGFVHTPSVSPDGTLVACFYWDARSRPAGKIALLPIEGGPPVEVFDEPERLTSPVLRWTADGRALVYARADKGVSNLWTLPLDARPAQPLTNFTASLIFGFAYSPDHKQLALARGQITEHVVLISDFR